MGTLEIGELTVGQNSTAKGRLGTIHLADSTAIHIPLMVINGRGEGPVLWLSAAMHGQELSGIGVIWEIVNKIIKHEELNGAVVAVPLLNPLSFTGDTYFTPQDGLNLTRAFPGDPKGGLTERMANLILEKGIKKTDVVMDLHCNPGTAMMFNYVFDPDDDGVGAESYRLAKAFGLTIVERSPKQPGESAGMLDAAYYLGKPSLYVELIPYYNIDPRAVRVGVIGVLNVMKSLQMIEGEIESQEDVCIIDERLGIIQVTSNSGGFVIPDTKWGEPVKKGQIVGHVVNAYEDQVEEIVSPVNGWILTWPFLNQSVYSGDLLAMYVYPKEIK